MHGNYKDSDKGVTLQKGDVVEVLDTENPDKWLVRKADDTAKVSGLYNIKQ